MKKLLFVAIIMVATIAVSCSKSGAVADVTVEPEYYEVKIGMVGAITSEITELTKADEVVAPLIGVNVWQFAEGKNTYSRYAYGLFDDINKMVVKLLTGYKYKFEVMYISDKSEDFYGIKDGFEQYYGAFALTRPASAGPINLTNRFNYSSDTFVSNIGYKRVDMFYGQTNDYVPSHNESVSVDLSRYSFGLRIDIQNFLEGKLSVHFRHQSSSNGFSLNLTPEDAHYEKIWCLAGLRDCYEKIVNGCGRLDENGEYYEPVRLEAILTNSDGVNVPLGQLDLKLQRNKLIKIKINAAPPTNENSFSLTFSDDELVDNEDDTYNIGDNGVIDTPVE